MRIAIGGMLHESNTFLSVPTTLDRFRESSLLERSAIIPAWRDAPHEWAGFIEGLETEDVEIVPLIVAHAMPSGTLTKDCFEHIAGRIVTLLEESIPVDGVLLGLHGATVSEEYPDADGEVIRRVRELVGPWVPIVVTLDCHANVSKLMFEQANVLVIYRSCPHLDQKQRGLEAASVITRIVRREINPYGAFEQPPMFINITRQHTDEEPAVRIRQRLAEALERPEIVAGSFALGFPYADVPEMGMSFLAYSDGGPEPARQAVRWMAEQAWNDRREYLVDAMDVEAAVREAAASDVRPVVLNDIGDNVGGGSAADSTFLLHEAYGQGVRGMCIVLYDPEAVQACIAAGVGSDVSLKVGGKFDDMHGAPVAITGRVRVITDGTFEETEARHMGMRHFNQGPTAVVQTPEDHVIMLTTYRQAPASLQQITHAGIDPAAMQMIVAKGVILPRPAYDPIAARTILVNSPGSTTAKNELFEYHRRRSQLFPFETDAAYTPGSGPVI